MDIESKSNIRWVLLLLSCLMLFGNYYAFDNPSALNRQLREFLGSSSEEFHFQLNLLYSVYSLPNVVLPLILGVVLDRVGHRQMVYILSVFIVLGQVIFTVGVSMKQFPLMLIGRIVFGIGGESLGVAQTKLMTDWFRGKELSLAIGVNLSVGRIGTVANNLLSPYFASQLSVPFALWIGSLFCFLSFLASIWTTRIDSKYRTHFINVPIELSKSNSSHKLEMAMEHSEKKEFVGYHPSFWLLTVITFLLYGVLVPFNNIASDFLQTKYPYLDPIKAGRLMSIPDTLCVFIVPILGLFLDRIGYRGLLFTVGSSLMSISHLLFAFSAISPYVILAQLGLSNSTLLAIWPCVPLLVSKDKLSTAYGTLTAASNLSFMLIPIIVAALVSSDPSYTSNEIFFASLTGIGFILGILMNWWSFHESLGLNSAECLFEKDSKFSSHDRKVGEDKFNIESSNQSFELDRFPGLSYNSSKIASSELEKTQSHEDLTDCLAPLLESSNQSQIFRRSKHGIAQ